MDRHARHSTEESIPHETPSLKRLENVIGGNANHMATKQINVPEKKQLNVQGLSVISAKPFQEVVSKLEAAVGHPDMNTFWKDVASSKTFSEVEKVVDKAIGPSGFMEFTRFDHGQFLRKVQGAGAPRVLRLVIGNPLIMKRMAEHVPDAGSYAPVTILIGERPDGVHLSYDTMTSFLASYENPEALKVAQELDSKIEALLKSAAG
jgi:uncharacterized protein (DUF302 family)